MADALVVAADAAVGAELARRFRHAREAWLRSDRFEEFSDVLEEVRAAVPDVLEFAGVTATSFAGDLDLDCGDYSGVPYQLSDARGAFLGYAVVWLSIHVPVCFAFVTLRDDRREHAQSRPAPVTATHVQPATPVDHADVPRPLRHFQSVCGVTVDPDLLYSRDHELMEAGLSCDAVYRTRWFRFAKAHSERAVSDAQQAADWVAVHSGNGARMAADVAKAWQAASVAQGAVDVVSWLVDPARRAAVEADARDALAAASKAAMKARKAVEKCDAKRDRSPSTWVRMH